MAGPFAITVASKTVLLDVQRRGGTTFTVGNLSGRKLRGRAALAPQKPAAPGWLTLAGAAERDLPVGGSVQYEVNVAVPANAPAGGYAFRLDMAAVDAPGESFTQGPTVTFNVPGGEARKPYPFWLLLMVRIVLLLAIAYLIFILLANR